METQVINLSLQNLKEWSNVTGQQKTFIWILSNKALFCFGGVLYWRLHDKAEKEGQATQFFLLFLFLFFIFC